MHVFSKPHHRQKQLAFCILSLWLVLDTAPQALATDILNPSERAWLTAHLPIRLAPEKNYPPFVFADDRGTVRGLSVDYIRKIEDKLGIHFRFLPADSLNHILPALQRGEADLHPALRETPERAAYLSFTRPYARIHAVLITASAAEAPVPRLAELGGQKVAVGDGYAVQNYLMTHFPALVLIPAADDERCLEKVRAGEVAAAVVDVASALWLIHKHAWSDLRVGTDVGFTYDLRLATRRDLPELHQILDKALAAIPSDEHTALLNQWISNPTDEPGFPWIAAIPTLLVGGLIAAGLIHRYRSHRGRDRANRN